ncbi:glutathione S-transferase family protein [Larsenimonas rhizosphaerae]|uniref:Glutathione S-transferase family protein n=1 Tax=Larsenimonas rhizosphaerae TaxID=2944682 RepID=A0AA42CXR2_9GAMM|nr:glutathione S-transferase family protein [Larsenimonas rhizosphaerae]MCM2129509.1 glutathione S-transferase family protein [Larsenimonas rhizosphaerae]MCX2524165.1 glutathione S-transferase family protein [Larsenimonas rhizosphaerae]
MIVLYGYPHSRSARVAWVLEELSLEYEYRMVDLKSGAGQQPEHLARHPDGKVPVLCDGDLTLFESAAICRYLAVRDGEHRLMPADPAGQAVVDQWLSFITTELEQPLWTQAKHSFLLPEAQRRDDIIPVARWEFDKAMQALMRRFDGQGHVTGALSLADLFLAQTLAWARGMVKHELPETLDAYTSEMIARPAFERARRREAC